MPAVPGKIASTQGLRGPLSIQRKEAAGGGDAQESVTAPSAAVQPVIVEDDVTPGPGQVGKSQYIASLEPLLQVTAADELGPLVSTIGCPYITQYLALFAGRSAHVGEQFIRKLTGSKATTPQELTGALLGRVRVAVQKWGQTRTVPPEVVAAQRAAESPAAIAGTQGPPVQHKTEGGGAGPATNPQEVLARLGEGAALDSTTQSRMAQALGASFDHVRIHTDAQAGQIAREQGALAFTVGAHVAFAPGRYAPGTLEGDALLAHELTHVMQQHGASPTGTSGAGAAAEHDADESAAAAVQALHGQARPDARAGAKMSSGFALQRCAGEPAQTGLMTTDVVGAFVGQKVGEAPSHVAFSEITTSLRAERTLGVYDSEAAAIAAVKTNGRAGAVTVEGSKFVAYVTDLSFSYKEHVVGSASGMATFFYPPKLEPGVVVLISRELMECRASTFDPTGTKQQGSADKHLASVDDPFRGYKEALGDEDGDLNGVDDDKLVAAFDAALKDTALVVLNRSEQEVRTKKARFDRTGASGVSASEIGLMKSVAGELTDIDAKLTAQSAEIADLNLKHAMTMPPAGGGAHLPSIYDEPLKEARARHAALQTQRRIIVSKYPLLSRVEPAAFKELSDDEMVKQLGAELPGILGDIATTKENVADGSVNLWAVDSVVEATLAGFGLDETKRKVILDVKQDQASRRTIESVVLAVFAIGFGIAAAFATGGASLFLAAGAFGIGTYDAMKQTEQYLVDKPASNVDLDKEGGFTEAPGWGWLVVAWVGVGLDAAQVLKAVGPIAKAEKSITEGAKELATSSAKKLGMTEETLAAKLRQVAGDVDGATKFGEAHKAAVAGRLGTSVDIDPKLVADVRVLYELETTTGRVRIKGIVAGPEATLAEVLAHENVIKLMRRYDGLSGMVRELWDKMLVLAGKGKNVNPFPAGSKAWESWLELKKLPELIEARMLKYGDGAKDGVRASNESALAGELEFLEDHLKRHRAVVEAVDLERGVGFVAATGDSTRAAFAKGYPLPDGCTTVEEMLEKGYFYRTASDGSGTFEIARKAESGAPPLRVEVTAGKPTLVPGGEMTRAEEASAIVKGFPEPKQTRFEALKAAEEAKGNKVVPIKGIHTTDSTIAKLTRDHGPATFAQDLRRILLDAYKRKGATDAATQAAAAAKKLLDHELVIIQGTDQLRAYGYRAAHLKATGKAADEVDDLHHMIPLYLGGDHVHLIDIHADLHDKLHKLIEGIKWDKAGTSLAPHSIQRGPFNFQEGAAILHPDGTITFDLLEAAKTAQ